MERCTGIDLPPIGSFSDRRAEITTRGRIYFEPRMARSEGVFGMLIAGVGCFSEAPSRLEAFN